MSDSSYMERAIRRAENGRLMASPNPWVGSVLVAEDGTTYEGHTLAPGNMHSEIAVLDIAGSKARGATLYVTLEPCCHQGSTPPCTQALLAAGIKRVVIGVEDPDQRVNGKGIAELKHAGVDVHVGVCAKEIERQLAPYLKHRRSAMPYVTVKMAATLDGKTSANDGTSKWITGPQARQDVHRLRAESDAILVGAGTVRADDPLLTARNVMCPNGTEPKQPLRVVLGDIPPDAKVLPALSLRGDLREVLAELGRRNIVQVFVEGGANVAAQFHEAGLVDTYVLYLAPAIMGGVSATPVFGGQGTDTIAQLPRGKFQSITKLGDDIRIEMCMHHS